MALTRDMVVAAAQTLDHVAAGGRTGLAVSGGRDSMVLLAAVARAHDAGAFVSPPIILHVDHGLRPEAADDGAFVAAAAQRVGFTCLSVRLDVKAAYRRFGHSIEAAARALRYRWLEDTAAAHGVQVIATAHHLDDQQESVGLHLTRRGDLESWSGIRASRPVHHGSEIRLVRPFLDLTAAELGRWATANDVRWRVDATNADRRFLRNRIRHDVLGDARGGAGLATRLGNIGVAAADLVRRIDALIPTLLRRGAFDGVAGDAESRATLRLDALREWPDAVATRVLEEIVRRLGIADPVVPLRLLRRVHTLADGSRAAFELPSGVRVSARREAGVNWLRLHLATAAGTQPHAEFEPCDLSVPGAVTVTDRGIVIRAVHADALPTRHRADQQVMPRQVIAGSLTVRGARPGERLRPFGAPGHRLVFDLLAEAGVPQADRRGFPVVADDLGILWIPGIRAAERCRVLAAPTPALIRLETTATPSVVDGRRRGAARQAAAGPVPRIVS